MGKYETLWESLKCGCSQTVMKIGAIQNFFHHAYVCHWAHQQSLSLSSWLVYWSLGYETTYIENGYFLYRHTKKLRWKLQRFIFLKIGLFIFKESGGREKERFHPSILGLTPQIATKPSWTKPKPPARNSILVFLVGGRWSITWTTICCFPRYITRELDWKQSSWNLNWHSDNRVLTSQASSSLTDLAATPGLDPKIVKPSLGSHVDHVFHHPCDKALTGKSKFQDLQK